MGALGQPQVNPAMQYFNPGGALSAQPGGYDNPMAAFGLSPTLAGPQSPYAKKLDEAASQVLGDPSTYSGALAKSQDDYDTAKNSKLAAIKRAAALISGSKGTANTPLMAFASGLMGNAGTFGTALGQAFGAAYPEIQKQREQERLINTQLGNLDIAGADTEMAGALQEQNSMDKRFDMAGRMENYAAGAQGRADADLTRRLISSNSAAARISAAQIAADKNRYRPTNQVTEDGHYAIYLDTHTGQNVLGPAVMPKVGGAGGVPVFELKRRAWLAVHEGDDAGALDFANGHRSLSDQEMMRSAQTLALRDLGPGSDKEDIDARAGEYFEGMKHPPGSDKPAPAAGGKPGQSGGKSPPAGFKQAPDGKYYAPDPKRPGKYVQWTP